MKKSLHTLTLGERGQTHEYVVFSKSIFILEIARSSGLAGIIFHFRLEGKKRIRMSCFLLELQIMNSVKYNFIMLKN